MKIIPVSMAILAILLSSCGHNISVYSKGVGAELAWRPNTIMPSIRFGSYENLDLVQKENNQVRYASDTGVGFNWFGLGSLFGGKKNDVGTGTVLEMKTGPQINGYASRVLTSPEVRKEHVEIAKSIMDVDISLGDGETVVDSDMAKTNATPVVVTEKGALGGSKVTTPTNQYTKKSIKKQVRTSNIYDTLKSYGIYILCAVALLLLALVYVIVHLLQKASILKMKIAERET